METLKKCFFFQILVYTMADSRDGSQSPLWHWLLFHEQYRSEDVNPSYYPLEVLTSDSGILSWSDPIRDVHLGWWQEQGKAKGVGYAVSLEK